MAVVGVRDDVPVGPRNPEVVALIIVVAVVVVIATAVILTVVVAIVLVVDVGSREPIVGAYRSGDALADVDQRADGTVCKVDAHPAARGNAFEGKAVVVHAHDGRNRRA